jgi:glyoxylase-like metal-dependent hydrolase (beta-lactamase superfamily II)/predicted ester cyclase
MSTQTEPTSSTAETERVVRAYFEDVERNVPGAQLQHYSPTARATIHGQTPGAVDASAIAEQFKMLYEAFPDFTFRIQDIVAQDDRAAVYWKITATFAGPGSFQGFEPTGGRMEVEGVDFVWVANGAIERIEAFSDGMTVARQLGLLPPAGSATEARMAKALNTRTRLGRLLGGSGEPEQVADGVWRVQGQPARCNIYFVRDTEAGSGVVMFDAGAHTMVNSAAAAGAKLGGINRILLGHGHTDHRGTAPFLGAPVYCHPDEVVDAEGSGGFRYWGEGLPKLPIPTRQLHLWFHRRFWDGGPVKIAGTFEEGDEVAGFRVVHIPGHAPGLIALYRERDGVALTSDCFYTLNNLGRDCPPHVPIHAYNLDTEQAIDSIRKLAALEPSVCWPGHANAVTGDVRAQLERAADAG